MKVVNVEVWKQIEYDTRYQVSNYGRFRKKNLKNGYRYLKPFRKHKRNIYVVKIRDKEFVCSRLVANAFIRKLLPEDRIYHKNKLEFDNYYRNLIIMSLEELGKRTGYISRSKRVVEVKDNEIVRSWRSTRQASKELYISRQTVGNYCNNKVFNKMYNLMWEDDYFDKVLPSFSWEHRKRK